MKFNLVNKFFIFLYVFGIEMNFFFDVNNFLKDNKLIKIFKFEF